MRKGEGDQGDHVYGGWGAPGADSQTEVLVPVADQQGTEYAEPLKLYNKNNSHNFDFQFWVHNFDFAHTTSRDLVATFWLRA